MHIHIFLVLKQITSGSRVANLRPTHGEKNSLHATSRLAANSDFFPFLYSCKNKKIKNL